MPNLVNIGFGSIVATERIICVVSPDSAPIKRLIRQAREQGQLIDATYGRRTRAVLVMDSQHVILAAVQPETVVQRLTTRPELSEDAPKVLPGRSKAATNA